MVLYNSRYKAHIYVDPSIDKDFYNSKSFVLKKITNLDDIQLDLKKTEFSACAQQNIAQCKSAFERNFPSALKMLYGI